MKTILQISSQLPAWQKERASILSRVCKSFKGRIGRGEKRCKASRRLARHYDGQALKSDPARTLKLKPVTLRRIFKAWQAGGENSSAFKLHYQPRRSKFCSETLIQFLEFVITGNNRSLKSAWKSFSAGKPSLPSYYAARWAFTAARFYEIQAKRNIVILAAEEFQELRLKAAKQIREAFPNV